VSLLSSWCSRFTFASERCRTPRNKNTKQDEFRYAPGYRPAQYSLLQSTSAKRPIQSSQSGNVLLRWTETVLSARLLLFSDIGISFRERRVKQYILWIYRYDSQPYRNNVAGIGSASTDTHPVAFSRPTISPTSGSFTQPNLNKVQHDRITNAYGSISPVSSL